ncbi:DUF4374 domain-containing protein [Aquimarina sp. I32.4]|uniref:DUF4374 domain-containing protein n=1 Tax=Aquimarina sp. I32.4 TaxID=2053903 RepID=UPI0011AFC69B|nr:DUF4374 domain-containing protein [Aquimarina sp. I32.4]
MSKLTFKILSILMVVAMIGCSSDDNNPETDTPGTEPPVDKKSSVALFVITDPNTSSGLLIPGEEMFSGVIDPSSVTNAVQLSAMRTIGKAIDGDIYNTSNSAGDTGLQKFSYADNTFTDAGFIAVNERRFIFEVVSPTKGYYTDSNRSRTAIQTFNPSTMQRTGEIDITDAITPLLDNTVTSTRLGSFMVESQGKLYTQLFFLKEDGTYAFDITYVAVFNTNNDTFIGLTQHNGYNWLGFERKNSNYVNVAPNGDIYLSSPVGNPTDPAYSRTLRIKAGANTFDNSWKLNYDEIIGGHSFLLGGPAIIGDKLYIKLKSTAIAPDWSNVADKDFDAYEVDIASKEITKITSIPGSAYVGSSVNGPMVIDNKVYFAVSNATFQGYYTYDPATRETKEAFSVKGGIPNQLTVLK